MADVRLSQAVGLTETSGQSARLSQAAGLTEASGQTVRLSQVVGLVEADKVQVRLSQVIGLIEAEFVPIVMSGAADIPGSRFTGSEGSSARFLSSSPTRPRQVSGGIGSFQVPEDSQETGSWTPGQLTTPQTGIVINQGRFSVEIFDRSGVRLTPLDLEMTPIQYSSTAIGGPDQAIVRVSGGFPALWSILDYLGFTIRIVSPTGRVVWEGIVERADVTSPAYTVGLSLRSLYNRVQVQYSRTMDSDFVAESLVTSWAQEATSFAKYGPKELKASQPDGSLTQAEALRDTLLIRSSRPQVTIDIREGEPGGQLSLIGRWLALEWTYYTNDDGYILYEPERAREEILGFALVGEFGFHEDSIHDIEMRLSVLKPGVRLMISGSVLNDGVIVIDDAPSTTIDDQVVYTGNNVSFDVRDDVFLPTPEIFTVGEMIRVLGSTKNDGYFWIKRIINGERFEIYHGDFEEEAAGSTVTITEGHSARTRGTFYTETPGAAVTLSSYTRIAQKIAATGSWAAQDILIMASREGSPADALRVSLYSDSGGAPGTLLESGEIVGDFVDTELGWVEITLDSAVDLTTGTDYWVVVERTGAADNEAFWHVGVSDEMISTFRAKVWDGSAWIDHPDAVDLPLRVWGTVDSSVKAAQVAASSRFVRQVDRRAETGTRVRLFSDGSKRVSEELQALVDAGDDSSSRLLCWFDGDTFVIDVEHEDDGTLGLASDGRVVTLPQTELEAGVLPVRRWLRILEIPPGDVFEDASPVFIESASYATESKALSVQARANQGVWR